MILKWLQAVEYYFWRRYIHQYDSSSRNYQRFESAVPNYVLPDPLKLHNGTLLKDVQDWEAYRRSEILNLFRTNIYGKSPPILDPQQFSFHVESEDLIALHGLATRKEIVIRFTYTVDGPALRLLLYLPNSMIKAKQACPVFVGLNYFGNHTIHTDPGITLNTNSSYLTKSMAESRGMHAYRWPIEMILQRGYAIGTVCYGDILFDQPDTLKQGLHTYIYQSGQAERSPDEGGAISAWAWGLMRVMDYCSHEPMIDSHKVIVIGHSRLGKTALWAAAQDSRFAMAIANNSGCGGARIFRRFVGETIAMINRSFPHWFCDNFKNFNDREQDLPVDQHMLIGLIAPRPVYVSSAQRDISADPKGEFLGVKNASSIYQLYGLKGLPVDEMPPISTPVMGTLGYHIRPGSHDITLYDWQQYLRFADQHFYKNYPEKREI